jgi:hypothetical protein
MLRTEKAGVRDKGRDQGSGVRDQQRRTRNQGARNKDKGSREKAGAGVRTVKRKGLETKGRSQDRKKKGGHV